MALPPPHKPELKSGAPRPPQGPLVAAAPRPAPQVKEAVKEAAKEPDKATARPVQKPGPGVPDRPSARPLEKPVPKGPQKAPDKAPDKAPARLDEKGPPRPPERAPGGGPGGPGGSGGDRSVAATVLRERITAQARRFSVPALLELLHAMGYRDEEIEYRSYQSQRPQPDLVHSIEFVEPRLAGGLRLVIITVNIGLLTAQTPLPSYVMKILDQQDATGMAEFLAYFDHHLLRDRFQALYPERNRGLFVDWEETKAKLLRMLGLESPSTMYWLFQRVFPELGLVVRRGQQEMPLNALGALLGEAVLGERYTLGGIAQVPVGGMEITLCTEEPLSPAGLPWAQEAARRLREQILPMLRGVDLQLTVFLLFVAHTEWARLVHEQYLGFDPLRDESQRSRSQLVLLWRGDARSIE